MNSEEKHMKDSIANAGDSFVVDPLAEHEEQPDNRLGWPDRKHKANIEQQQHRSSESSGNSTQSEADTYPSEQGPLSAELTENETANKESPIEYVELENEPLGSQPSADWLKGIDSDNEQVSGFIEEEKTKKLSVFGMTLPTPKKDKRKNQNTKTEPGIGTDTNVHIDTDTHALLNNIGKPESGTPVSENGEPDDNFERRRLKLREVALGVGKAIGITTVGVLVFMLYKDVSTLKSNQNSGILELREQTVSEIKSLEQRVLIATDDLHASVKSINEQMTIMKAAGEEREAAIGMLLEEGDKSLAVEAIKEMVDVDRAVISKLDANIAEIGEKLLSLEKKGMNITISKKIPQKAPAPKAATPRTVSSVEGYSLFSVDLWANTPILVLIKGTEIKRVKEGANFLGWQVSNIDSYKKRATLRKGSVTNHLQG